MAYSINKSKLIFHLGYVVAFFTLLSLFLLTQATEGSQQFEALYQVLLITIVVGISCLFIIVGFYLYKTIKHYRQAIPGASLSVTILLRTFLLAFIPLLVIAFFAFKFLRYEFKSSFDQGIDDALNNALVLSKKALDVRALEALNKNQSMANLLAPHDLIAWQLKLEPLRQQIKAHEITIFDENGFIQAYASEDLDKIIPEIPEHSDFIRVHSEQGIFAIESGKKQYQIRTLAEINSERNYYLQSVFLIPNTVSALTDQVNKTITERDKLNYLMPRVSSSFIFVLVLVLLLACLLLMLSSIGFASYMVQPIRDLIRGTKNVSQGDFDQHVLVKRKDDFGTLIQSFNQMTQSLKFATEEAEINRYKVESERAYLATVINHMTSGVITLDYKHRLLTYNELAEALLNCQLDQAVFAELSKLDLSFESYKSLMNQLNFNRTDSTEVEIEIAQENDTIQLIARLAALPSTDELHGGYVIIFNEFSEYWQRQKQAAWEEVARRLAHEIKNPLTPILLAAERLNYKLSGHLAENEQQVLSRSIDVIANQVKSLKNMVDDFSDYAKPITAKKVPLPLNTLIKDVFDLYQGHFERVTFELNLLAKKDNIYANANLLRQVLHNLIKNAIEASEKQPLGEIVIMTENDSEKNNKNIKVSIIDNGSGLPENEKNVFDPYITTKEKGTGLGLAIVKKIVQEHQGTIELTPRQSTAGTIASMVFPLISENKTNESTTI